MRIDKEQINAYLCRRRLVGIFIIPSGDYRWWMLLKKLVLKNNRLNAYITVTWFAKCLFVEN